MVDPQGWGSKPRCRVGLFPGSDARPCSDADLVSVREISVAIETSYFRLTCPAGSDDPAGVEILRDGGVAPRHKVP